MSDAKSLFVPSSPKNIAVRPPNKGMIRHLPAQAIPKEACLVAKNIYFTPGGAKRRPAWQEDAANGTVSYTRIDGIGVIWDTSGDQDAFVVDDKFLYTVGGAGEAFTGVYWTYTSGNANASGTSVTGIGTKWDASSLDVGDVIVLDADGSGAGPEVVTIAGVNTSNDITVGSTFSTTYTTADYEIRRAFAAGPVDWAVGLNKVFFADGARELYVYNASGTFEGLTTDGYVPSTVAYWRKRVWIGRIQETSADYRSRIRWSSVSDVSDFTSTDYIDLPYTVGKIRKILPMGNLLYIYFSDAIYVGRPSNGTYPIEVQRVETGGIGLIGLHAIAPWFDGHYFVGQDDIYYVSQAGMKRIGTPIVADTIEQCEYPDYIYVAPDPKNERIVFGFPKDQQEISRLWSFFYKTNSWAYDDIKCDSLGYADFIESVTWANIMNAPYTSGSVTVDISADSDRMTGAGTVWASEVSSGDYVFVDKDGDGVYEIKRTVSNVVSDTAINVTVDFTTDVTAADYRIVASDQTWEDLPYTSWGTIRGVEGASGDLYFGKGVRLYRMGENGYLDDHSDPVSLEYTTGDLDMGAPNRNKIVTRLSLKTKDAVPEDVVFHIYGSTNRGQTWKTLSPAAGVTIDAETDETKCDFRLMGSLMRFKITSTSSVVPYTISEIVYRVRGAGEEVPERDI